MNKVADFSDTLADRWDELCYHDPEKLNDILQRACGKDSVYWT